MSASPPGAPQGSPFLSQGPPPYPRSVSRQIPRPSLRVPSQRPPSRPASEPAPSAPRRPLSRSAHPDAVELPHEVLAAASGGGPGPGASRRPPFPPGAAPLRFRARRHFPGPAASGAPRAAAAPPTPRCHWPPMRRPRISLTGSSANRRRAPPPRGDKTNGNPAAVTRLAAARARPFWRGCHRDGTAAGAEHSGRSLRRD